MISIILLFLPLTIAWGCWSGVASMYYAYLEFVMTGSQLRARDV